MADAPPSPGDGAAGYGMLLNNTKNIGDEIQAVAAARFLPRVDDGVLRDRIGRYRRPAEAPFARLKVILNAWWSGAPRWFVPSGDIEGLPISMHINRRTLAVRRNRDFLARCGGVGCRDEFTRRQLAALGIPAYFSGCLTLTLPRHPDQPREDYVLAVDIPDEAVAELRRRTRRDVIVLGHDLSCAVTYSRERWTLARILLQYYQRAHCVVSSRLHVVFPCTAFETPALWLNHAIGDADRFDGLEPLLRATDLKAFLAGADGFDPENPTPNPPAYRPIREALIERARAFTGHDDPLALAPMPHPALTLLSMLGTHPEKRERGLYAHRSKTLFRHLVRKWLLRKKLDDFPERG